MIAFAGDLNAAGFIPMWLSEGDPRPATEQINERYAHGGGWSDFSRGWKHLGNCKLKYPGDPVMTPIAYGRLRREIICVYPHAWVAVFQPDKTFQIARID